MWTMPRAPTEPAPDVRGSLDALDAYPAFFAYNANVDAIRIQRGGPRRLRA